MNEPLSVSPTSEAPSRNPERYWYYATRYSFCVTRMVVMFGRQEKLAPPVGALAGHDVNLRLFFPDEYI